MNAVEVRRLCGLATALVLLGGARTALAQGTVSGVVRDSATQQPIPSVQVRIAGSTIGTLTDAQGHYRLTDVPSGTIRLRARIIAYRPAEMTVQVPPGGEAPADFQLVESALTLDELVVTATGTEESARQQSTAVTQIEVPSEAPVTNMSEELNSRVAGVEVKPSSGTVGTGTAIHIRGLGSVSLNTEPIIYVDGVRVNSDFSSSTAGTAVGGQVPSRLNDIDPSQIASIQVIKGPADAALYGTDAANGIISITTKRGHNGPAVWHAYVEDGALDGYSAWPDNVFGFDTTKSLSISTQAPYRYGCTLVRVSAGQCTQTGGLYTNNPLRNASPFRTGFNGQYGLSSSGGSERMTYFIAGDITNQNGTLPNNGLDQYNLRGNLTAALSPTLDLAVQTGYVSSRLRLPDNDNDALGYLGSGLLGKAAAPGWGFLLPSQIVTIQSDQSIDRFTTGANADFRPFAWLTMHGVAGLDYSTRFDTRTFEPGLVPFSTGTLQGSRNANTVQTWDLNDKASAVASFALTPDVTTQTTLGVDFFHSKDETILASGQQLAAGTNSLAGVVVPSVNETLLEVKTLGVYGEEQVGWRQRVYITAALRHDDNSAFGKVFPSITYPKFGGSWVISDEPFFPKSDALSSLHLRAAYGVVGLAPTPNTALQFYTPAPAIDQSGNQAAFTVGNLGDPNLKPERDAETDVGFDAGLMSNRVSASFTYYQKFSHDALVSRILPGSLGDTTAQFYNLGEIANKGLELDLTGHAFSTHNLSLDLAASFWTNANKVVDLGGVPPISFLPQMDRVGYPVGGYFTQRILSYTDSAGIVRPKDVKLDTALSYVGSPYPTRGWGFTPTVTLFERFQVSATLDHRGGNYLYNLTAEFRCRVNVCPEASNPKTPLARQAQMISDVYYGQPNGYIEPAGFTKLRELSIAFFAPSSWARLLNASALTITVAGRNLKTWTKYSGFDPELSQVGQGTTVRDFLTLPPNRYWSARIDLTY